MKLPSWALEVTSKAPEGLYDNQSCSCRKKYPKDISGHVPILQSTFPGSESHIKGIWDRLLLITCYLFDINLILCNLQFSLQSKFGN